MSDEGDGRRRDSDAGEVDDPFDSLEVPAAEVDDPFAELGAGVEGDDPDGGDPDGNDPDGNDPDGGASDSDPVDPAPVDPESGASGARRDDPFDELGPADSETDLDEAFERMDVGGPVEEDVWESLDADAAGTDSLGEATAVPGGGDTEHVVSKRTYCQQCPHFTPPPEVACGHEGTTILEAVGFDEFRVRNCPMISEEDPTFDSGE
ncbi:hypothetical protein [Halorubrum depositum]|uniref:hypothetical protein n=1 Tax=Halorubrum depositum TaxID=2583992 RepID=UPI0011A62DF6|nr:hypothetical protein [Halorubrum depositum]